MRHLATSTAASKYTKLADEWDQRHDLMSGRAARLFVETDMQAMQRVSLQANADFAKALNEVRRNRFVHSVAPKVAASRRLETGSAESAHAWKSTIIGQRPSSSDGQLS